MWSKYYTDEEVVTIFNRSTKDNKALKIIMELNNKPYQSKEIVSLIDMLRENNVIISKEIDKYYTYHKLNMR